MTDLALAILHHLLVFTLAGIIAFEIAVIRPGLTSDDITRVARVDLWYGILAGAILIVGFSRATFAAKGWAYYSHNWLFWAKIGVFGLVGLLSIVPTLSLLRWRKTARHTSFEVDARELRHVRGHLFAEAALFALLPIFAAGMARGYGLLR